MKEKTDIDRRTFLKSTTLATAGLAVIGVNQENALSSSAEWTNRSPINPAISNTKVVCCHDETMITDVAAAKIASTLSAQNALLNTSKVEANLDQLVMRLTGKSTAQSAWETIFRKPAAKQWADIKVALKVNCIDPKNMPRVAIVGKVCKELVMLGVVPANMTIYDGGHDASGDKKYPPFIGNGIPEGVNVQSGKGSTTSIEVGSGKMNCTNIVILSDILVNFAVNKGHGQDKGGFTLTMKNHTGTMKFSCPSAIEMVNQNKSATILGGAIPRQQLCIVDSIWAEKKGPVDAITHLPCRIVMGIMGPAVDVLTARNIREKLMSASHNETAIETLVSGFGYTESEFEWEEFTPSAVGTVVGGKVIQSFSDLSLNIKGGNRALEHVVNFQIPSEAALSKAVIVNMFGAIVKSFSLQNRKTHLEWDGMDKSGKSVVPGMYVIKITAGNFTDAKVFSLVSR